MVAGGVGANRNLRSELATAAAAEGASVYYPRPEFCTDNGAMVAHAGWWRLRAGCVSDGRVVARSRWELAELTALDSDAQRTVRL